MKGQTICRQTLDRTFNRCATYECTLRAQLDHVDFPRAYSISTPFFSPKSRFSRSSLLKSDMPRRSKESLFSRNQLQYDKYMEDKHIRHVSSIFDGYVTYYYAIIRETVQFHTNIIIYYTEFTWKSYRHLIQWQINSKILIILNPTYRPNNPPVLLTNSTNET